MMKPYCDLSIIIPINNNTKDLENSILKIRSMLNTIAITYEILIAGNEFDEHAQKLAHQKQCVLVTSPTGDFGETIIAGAHQSSGVYIITLDGDQTNSIGFLQKLWDARESADVVISSRYILGGNAQMPWLRKILSRALNIFFSRGLDLNIHDISSGFRLYKSHIIKNLSIDNKGFDILQEILVRIFMSGYKINEIPFVYQSNDPAYTRMIQYGVAYAKSFYSLWKLRNSIASADYDARAYNAMMPPQRYWQRQRYSLISGMLKDKGKCLDVGCGSSRIIETLPENSIALDILLRKLRYSRRFGQATVQGSIFNLPIQSGSFPCVLCSQVIEHVPRVNVLDELDRTLQPGGYLILGTPDYAKWQWNVIEWLYKVILPQAYADEHITHYTFDELFYEFVNKRGYKLEETHYILQGELILGLRKPPKRKN